MRPDVGSNSERESTSSPNSPICPLSSSRCARAAASRLRDVESAVGFLCGEDERDAFSDRVRRVRAATRERPNGKGPESGHLCVAPVAVGLLLREEKLRPFGDCRVSHGIRFGRNDGRRRKKRDRETEE